MRKLVIAIGTVLLLTSCGTPTPTPTPTPETAMAKLFWVADTGTAIRLFRESARIDRSDSPGLTALRYLVSHAPTDSDYTSLWPLDTVINSVTISGDQATVDLAKPKLNVGAESESLAIQQLLWTLLAAEPSVRSMRITVDGKTVESLAGHVDATQPFTRPPAYDVVAIVWLLNPAEGTVVAGSHVTLSGMACTFEANVVWTIRKNNKVVKSGSTTAAEACPTWSPWSVDVGSLPAGTYIADAADYSAKDGSLLVRDTKTFTVR